jgi:hypothetical protein
MKIITSISLISAIFMFSCSTTLPEIEGMNYEAWVLDKYGCAGERIELVSLIDVNKEKFLRYNQNEIIDILGRPENQTLFTRSQTIFYYYISFNPACEGQETRMEDDQVKLEIRFDALNRSKSLYVHNYVNPLKK